MWTHRLQALLGWKCRNYELFRWRNVCSKRGARVEVQVWGCHSDAPPSPIPNPCQDYGTIFLADNMTVTVAPMPIVLGQATRLGNGAFQFAFINAPGDAFTVLASTNASLPLASWNVLGSVTEISSGQYQFTDLQATNQPLCFYRVRSP